MRRFETSIAALALFAILQVLFFPYIWGDMSLVSSSAEAPSITPEGARGGSQEHLPDPLTWKLHDPNGSGQTGEPNFPLVAREVLRDHEPPLWNPDIAYGTPLAAAMQQQPFYPLAALVSLSPSPTSYAWYVVLRLFFAGFTTYLFVRMFASFLAALVSGIGFMLTGYFMLYVSMPHLSVETTLGALFLCVEWTLRRRTWPAVFALCAVVALNLFGGMPESSFLSIGFAALYALFRIASVSEFRANARASATLLLFAALCGFACCSFLTLPFAEFVGQSYNTHEASKNLGKVDGLVSEQLAVENLATYLVPLAFGTPFIGLAHGVSEEGYWGVSLTFLALAGAGYAIVRRRGRIAGPAAFFACALTALLCKRFGVPAVNWIGALPLLRLVVFYKYSQVEAGFALAVLAGFGVDAIRRARFAPKLVFVSAAMTLAGLGASFAFTAGKALRASDVWKYYYVAYLEALAALVLVTIACSVLASARSYRAAASIAVTLIVAVELGVVYVYPAYYRIDPGPSKFRDPYAGARYVDYLRANMAATDRVTAAGTGTLEPNWAEAFDIQDARDVDAIFCKRLFPFVANFLGMGQYDLQTAYQGSDPAGLASPLGRRFLALSSVRYIIAPSLTSSASVLASKHPTPFEIAGVWQDAVPERIGSSIEAPLDVRRPNHVLHLLVAVPTGFPTSNASVRFEADIVRARGPRVRFTKQITSASHRSNPGWVPFDLDVAKFANERDTITLAARANKTGAASLVLWADGELRTNVTDSPTFSLHRVDDVSLYRFADPLPRGAIYEHAIVTGGDDVTLRTLRAPTFDVYRNAVISGDSVPTNDAPLAQLLRQAPAAVTAAKLESYRPMDVRFTTATRRRALLVLNDTYYPGWHAYVDGEIRPLLRANYLFRGVVVEPGAHTVEFRYEPAPFYAGELIAALGVTALAAFAFLSHNRRSQYVKTADLDKR